MSTGSSPEALVTAWRALGNQLAAAAGSGVALISLLNKTPVSVASLRGTVALVAVMLLTRFGAGLARKTFQAPLEDPEDETQEPENSSKALPVRGR